MSNVVLYTKAYCPFCQRARALLDSKGVQYTVYDIGVQPELRDEMIAKAGGASTVPQIFINDEHIGGCDDMMAIEAQGKLDAKLNATLNA
ncbi:glutaredoxin 3 [Pseudoalteromonas sp.]|jgi:glutaredoxin 3